MDTTIKYHIIYTIGDKEYEISGEVQSATSNSYEGVPIEDVQVLNEVMTQISSPWIYIDEIFGITLPFLMGAVFFKNGKTVKTFIAIFAFSTAVSIITTPFVTKWAADIMNGDAMRMYDNGIFRNLVLIDTISDAIVNIALMIGIWFRIKTLKH